MAALSFAPQHSSRLTTSRLMLRAVANEDLSAIHAMRLNPAVMMFMQVHPPLQRPQMLTVDRPGVETELDALKSFSVKRMELMMKEHRFSFAVLLKPLESSTDQDSESQAIGFLGITSPPEIFYIFDEKYWGHGYATEGLQAFLKAYWATYPQGLDGVDDQIRDHLEAHVHDGNVQSERILGKCGFVHAGDGTTASHGGTVGMKIYRLDRPAGDTAP